MLIEQESQATSQAVVTLLINQDHASSSDCCPSRNLELVLFPTSISNIITVIFNLCGFFMYEWLQ